MKYFLWSLVLVFLAAAPAWSRPNFVSINRPPSTSGGTLLFGIGDTEDSVAVGVSGFCTVRFEQASGDDVSLYAVTSQSTAAASGTLLKAFTSSTSPSNPAYTFTASTQWVKAKAVDATAGGSKLIIECNPTFGSGGSGGAPLVEYAALSSIDETTVSHVTVSDCDDLTCASPGGGTTDVPFYFNGSAWVPFPGAAAGIASVEADASPTLGGDLDADDNTITNVSKFGARNFFVRTEAALRTAEGLCGEDLGETANPTGCHIFIDTPDLEITTAGGGTVEVAGDGTSAQGNVGIWIHGYGGGGSGASAGDAGTRIHGDFAGSLMTFGACINCGIEGVTFDTTGSPTAAIEFQGGPNVGFVMRDSGVIGDSGDTGVLGNTSTGQWDTATFQNVIMRGMTKCLHVRHSQSVGINWVESSCTVTAGVGPMIHAEYGEVHIERSYIGIVNDAQVGIELSATGSALNVTRSRIEYPGWSGNTDIDGVVGIKVGPATNGEIGAVVIADNKFVFSTAGNTAMDIEKRGTVSITNNSLLQSGSTASLTSPMLVARDDGNARNTLNFIEYGNFFRADGVDPDQFPLPWLATFTQGHNLRHHSMVVTSTDEPDNCTDGWIWVDTDAVAGSQIHVCELDDYVLVPAGGSTITFNGSTIDAGGGDIIPGVWIDFAPDSNPATNGTIDTNFGNTYASINGSGVAEQCGFTTSGTGSGGFLCEGPEADPTDHYFTFPLITDSGADTERFIPLASAGFLVAGPTAARTMTVPDADFTAVGTTATQTLTNKTLDTPNFTGAVDFNDSAVNDDDCTGQQGEMFYDSTDSAFEFCNANSGTPAVLGGSGGGDVTKVGTPANNQVGVWTGDGTIEGDSALTFDTSTDTLTAGAYDAPADATNGGSLVLKEGADDGSNTLTIKIPDSGGLSGDVTHTVTAAGKFPANSVAHTFTECFPIYAPTDTIADTDDIQSLWRAPAAVTITEVWCETDTGTVTADLQIDDGTPADIMGTDLVCDTSGETDSSGLTGGMADGDRLDLAITSVASSPTRVTFCAEYTYN